MWLIRFRPSWAEGAAPQPAPLPYQTVGCVNDSHFIAPHHGRLRQASLPVSPETAVHGGFAYASRLRSTPSRALNTALISNASTKGQVAR